MTTPAEALAAVERLETVVAEGASASGWTNFPVQTADLALLLALLKDAGKVLEPFAEMTGIPEFEDDLRVWLTADGNDLGFIRLGRFRAAAKLAELLPGERP